MSHRTLDFKFYGKKKLETVTYFLPCIGRAGEVGL